MSESEGKKAVDEALDTGAGDTVTPAAPTADTPADSGTPLAEVPSEEAVKSDAPGSAAPDAVSEGPADAPAEPAAEGELGSAGEPAQDGTGDAAPAAGSEVEVDEPTQSAEPEQLPEPAAAVEPSSDTPADSAVSAEPAAVANDTDATDSADAAQSSDAAEPVDASGGSDVDSDGPSDAPVDETPAPVDTVDEGADISPATDDAGGGSTDASPVADDVDSLPVDSESPAEPEPLAAKEEALAHPEPSHPTLGAVQGAVSEIDALPDDALDALRDGGISLFIFLTRLERADDGLEGEPRARIQAVKAAAIQLLAALERVFVRQG